LSKQATEVLKNIPTQDYIELEESKAKAIIENTEMNMREQVVKTPFSG
jgi:hypothetical protein